MPSANSAELRATVGENHGLRAGSWRARAVSVRRLALVSALALAYSACGDDGGSDDAGIGGTRGGASGASGRGGAGAGRAGAPSTAGGSGEGGEAGMSVSGGAPGGGRAGAPNGGTSNGGATSGAGGTPVTDGGMPGAAGGGASGDGGSATLPADGGAAGEAGLGGSGGEGGAPVAAPFCTTLGPVPPGVTARSCFDFDGSGSPADFTLEGGTWQVAGGELVGTGPEEPVNCKDAGSGMTASTVTGLSTRDVRVRAQLTGVDRADKIVILRSRDFENRIELNFRSNFPSGDAVDGGDLVVQEVVGCEGTFRVDPGQVLVPHALTQTLDVEIELRGQRLIVSVGGAQVLDRVFEGATLLSNLPGSAGVGVNVRGTVIFDDLVIEALEPAGG